MLDNFLNHRVYAACTSLEALIIDVAAFLLHQEVAKTACDFVDALGAHIRLSLLFSSFFFIRIRYRCGKRNGRMNWSVPREVRDAYHLGGEECEIDDRQK